MPIPQIVPSYIIPLVPKIEYPYNPYMVKNYIYILVTSVMVFIAAGDLCGQGLDSLRKVELIERLGEYFEALKYESIEVQKAECDFLIETANSQEVRDFIAQTIYDHYMASKIMGAEAVAVHLTDTWFIPKKVSFRDDSELFAARIFAEFNRQSLVGNKAPELEMETIDGEKRNLFGEEGNGRFKLLFFYDTDCVNCRLESIMLRNILETEDFPVDLYAVYVGDNRESWSAYAAERLTLEDGMASVVHLWDPSVDSDFQRKYGVLQTPRLFIISPDGTILGRGLDSQAVEQMLNTIFDEVELNYGGEESTALFEGILSSASTIDEVKALAEYITESTLPKGDTVMFRQLTGDLLYHLAANTGEGIKEGLSYLLDNKILNQDRIWRSKDDSLKIVGFAQIMRDLLDKARPGSRIADIKVPGEIYTWKKEKTADISLSKLKGNTNIIIFYTEGCEKCKAEKQAAREVLAQANTADKAVAKSARKIKVLMVNVDRIMAGRPDLAARLFDDFDLSTLPFIITTDRNGIIQHRYYSFL